MNSIFIANLGKYNEGEMVGDWFELGQDREILNKFLENVVGIHDEYDDYLITDTDITEFTLAIDEYDNVYDINDSFIRYNELSPEVKNMVQAIIEAGYYDETLEDAIERTIFYTLYTDLYELGCAVVNLWYNDDPPYLGRLNDYLDYETIGREYLDENKGTITSKGILIEEFE